MDSCFDSDKQRMEALIETQKSMIQEMKAILEGEKNKSASLEQSVKEYSQIVNGIKANIDEAHLAADRNPDPVRLHQVCSGLLEQADHLELGTRQFQ